MRDNVRNFLTNEAKYNHCPIPRKSGRIDYDTLAKNRRDNDYPHWQMETKVNPNKDNEFITARYVYGKYGKST